MIRVKRVYDPPEAGDGLRVLVDRLWPRGLARDEARVDLWLKEVAPSDGLRRDFHGDPAGFDDFAARYRGELAAPQACAALERLRAAAALGPVTLLFAARDRERNNAVVLAAVLEGMAGRS